MAKKKKIFNVTFSTCIRVTDAKTEKEAIEKAAIELKDSGFNKDQINQMISEAEEKED